MPTMITLVDGTIPVAADFNSNFTNLNNAIGVLTGITGYTTGDILYASATNTLSKLAAVSIGQALLSQGVTTAPLWSEPPVFNYTYNGDFEVWGAGTSSAPTGWTLSGAGASVAKNTTSGQFRFTTASAALTRAGTDCLLLQDIDTLTGFGPVGAWQSQVVTFGAWVRATVASRARLQLNDGVGTSSSSYHTGGSALEFLQVTRTLDAAATRVRIQLSVETGDTVAQIDGATLVVGSGVADYIPSGWRGRFSRITFNAADAVAAGATRYLGVWATDATETNEFIRQTIPFNYVVRRLYTVSTAAAGGGQTFVYTIRTEGAARSLTTTHSGAATTQANDTANEYAGSAGDRITLQVVNSAGGAATTHHGSVELEERP